jgi:Protein of unknown function (DUF2905)
MTPLGKGLILIGLLLVVAGALVWGFGQIPYLGRLPGDIYIRRGNSTFYFPLATCIVLSVVVSLVLALMRRG